MSILHYLGLAKISELISSEMSLNVALEREKEDFRTYSKDLNVAKFVIQALKREIKIRDEEILSLKKKSLSLQMEHDKLKIGYEALLRRID